MTSKFSEKCIKCRNPFLSMKQKTPKCLKCLNSLHNKCSTADKKQYLSYKNGKKDFICQYCTDYSCLKCDKHIYDRQPGILCNMCETFGFTGHVQEYEIYKIQTMMNPGTVDHVK